MSALSEIMKATQDRMFADLATARAALEHNGLKGTVTEEQVASLLRDRLPASLGVVAGGQAIDRTGQRSKQLDVIVYNKERCPFLMRSPGDQVLIPVEGVVAVIEVKMHLKRADIESVVANCRSVKCLQRDAYFDAQPRYAAYEQVWVSLPVHYSLFAFESDAMYGDRLNELQLSSHLHERVDLVCYLDRGINLNVGVRADDARTTLETEMRPTAFNGSVLMDAKSENPLVQWFLNFSTYVAQAQSPVINLMAYADPTDLHMTGTASGEGVNEFLLSFAEGELSKISGLPPEVFSKIRRREALTPDELQLLLQAGATIGPEGQVQITPLGMRGQA